MKRKRDGGPISATLRLGIEQHSKIIYDHAMESGSDKKKNNKNAFIFLRLRSVKSHLNIPEHTQKKNAILELK